MIGNRYTSTPFRKRFFLGSAVISLVFGLLSLLLNGFGSDIIFLLGLFMLLYGVWMLANVSLGGLGKGAARRTIERRTTPKETNEKDQREQPVGPGSPTKGK